MQAINETLILDEIHMEETLEAGKLDSYQIRWNKMDHLHDLSVLCQPLFSEFIATTHIFRDLSPYRPCQELNI